MRNIYHAEIYSCAPELTTLYRNNIAIWRGVHNYRHLPVDNLKNIKRTYRAHNKQRNLCGFKVYQITYNYEGLTNQKKTFLF